MSNPTFQLPDQQSSFAAEIDQIYYWIYWISVAFFVAIVGAMVWWCWKYRKRPGHKAVPTGHNLPLEIAWTVLPIGLIIWLFHIGFKGYLDMAVAPADSMEIRVHAFQWGWDFQYPTGETDSELHIPVNQDVKLIMSSNDVLHAFYAPTMRVKRDVVPGMYTSLWFRPIKTGTSDIECAEYCGGKSTQNGEELDFSKFSGHFKMLSKLHVETKEDFDKYMTSLTPSDPVELGASLYGKKACKTCHTIDGQKGVAPTWKGLWGKEETMNNGLKVHVDENYIRESILTPNAKIVMGYQSPSPMPTFQGTISDKDIDAIIAYMKTLK